MVDKVAADLCFRASKLRWLLPEKYFDFAASSAAGLLLDDNINNLRPNQPPRALKEPSLYIIVVLNTQRLGAFVLNIGAFCGNEDIYDMWKLLYYKHLRVGVFFLKKVFEC